MDGYACTCALHEFIGLTNLGSPLFEGLTELDNCVKLVQADSNSCK